MDPAFPDIVGEFAAEQVDGKAKIWIVERNPDGGLEERLDPRFFERLGEVGAIEDILEVLITAAAKQDVAETRVW
jgi:hypothetical protein